MTFCPVYFCLLRSSIVSGRSPVPTSPKVGAVDVGHSTILRGNEVWSEQEFTGVDVGPVDLMDGFQFEGTWVGPGSLGPSDPDSGSWDGKFQGFTYKTFEFKLFGSERKDTEGISQV